MQGQYDATIKFLLMKITFKTLKANIEKGSIELQSDLFGSTIKYATIEKIYESGKRSKVQTVEVTGTPTNAEKSFFNI